jgi:hypothetical protein
MDDVEYFMLRNEWITSLKKVIHNLKSGNVRWVINPNLDAEMAEMKQRIYAESMEKKTIQ